MGRLNLEVTVDHRERNSGVPEALESLGFQTQLRELRLGDYLVCNRLLFERKTLADFAVSIIDGRLFSQARRLVSSSHMPAIVLEGDSGSLKDSAMRRESIQGALISLGLVYGLAVLRSASPLETAELILFASQQTAFTRSRPLRRFRDRMKGKERMQLGLLEALPGIGPVRASALLEHFGSVEAVIRAPALELQQIEGIGPGTAKQIRWLVS